MDRSVVFRTPGLMDVRSFTAFGVNVKPLTVSPLGYFGTGLKYAIAVLVRKGLIVTVHIGKTKYTFYKKLEKFREKDFDFIRMKKETYLPRVLQWRKTYLELPFTTELGKNWELWQAFRELYTNTLDEKGETSVSEIPDINEALLVEEDETCIVVTGEAFVHEFYDKDRNFLPDGLRLRETAARMQVFDKPSSHIYYRGMRVYDLDKPSTLTYNFLCDVKLTEDRTAAQPYALQQEIAQYILQSEDEEEIKKVLSGEDTYESNINYQWFSHYRPSRAFTNIAPTVAKAAPTAAAVVRSYEPRRVVENPLARWPRPWRLVPLGDHGEHYLILDANHKKVLDSFTTDLSTEALRYIMALLQRDLPDDEFDAWIKDRPKDLSLTDTETEGDLRAAEEEDMPIVAARAGEEPGIRLEAPEVEDDGIPF